jgi:pimeloyl-ACP methyl ester carboxylesterase
VSLLVAGARADLVRGACLIEPVILPRSRMTPFYAPGFSLAMTALSPMSSGALRRRATFKSKEQACAALKGRGFFKNWSDEALSDYVEDGFVATSKGVKLACSPLFEARTFAAHAHDPWRALERAAGPIVILRAEKNSTTSEAAARKIAAMRPDARVGVVEGSTHALPMEKPDRVRAAIESATLLSGVKDRYIDVV